MRFIKIISGTYGHRPNGGMRMDIKRAGDPPFEVEDSEARRLVRRGVAAYAETAQFEDEDSPEDDTGEEPGAGGAITPGGKPPGDPVATPTGGADGAGPGADMPESESGAEDENPPQGAPAYSIDSKQEELRELMKACGLKQKAGMSKADMVAALDEYYGAEDGEECPPSLGAEGPVI